MGYCFTPKAFGMYLQQTHSCPWSQLNIIINLTSEKSLWLVALLVRLTTASGQQKWSVGRPGQGMGTLKNGLKPVDSCVLIFCL